MTRVKCANEDVKKFEEARQALAKLISYSNLPPRAFCNQSEPFKLFTESLNPDCVSYMDFKSLDENCLKIYKEERAKVKEIFSNFGGQISLSADSLLYEKSCMIVNEYYCITAHFIDDDWKLRKLVIKYCDDQKVVHSAQATLEALKEWDIEGKMLSLTANGTTDAAAVVKEELQGRRELALNGELFQVRCCSHVISRVVEKGFKMIDPIIDSVMLLAWSKSLPLWYLTSSKLRSALELEAMGEFSDAQGYDVPSEVEWGKVRSVCKIADRIYEITEGLFEVRRPTANLFLPHLLEILAYLTQESESTDIFVKAVAEKMLKKFNEYWEEMYLVLAIAAFLDPRYKFKLLEFSLSKLKDDKKAAHVLETLRKLYNGYMVQNDSKEYLLSDLGSESDDENDEEGSDMHEIKPSHAIKNKLNILREYTMGQTQPVSDQSHKSDLDLYLEEPVLPWTENFSVLLWWKDNCVKYPQLSKMARDFLAIPMSLANSYEAYYTEQRPADRTLVSLKHQLMNALKCTRSWKLGYRKH